MPQGIVIVRLRVAIDKGDAAGAVKYAGAIEDSPVGKNPVNLGMIARQLIGIKDAPPSTEDLRLMFTAPLEFFFTKLKLAGFGAVVMAFPVLAWQVYAFVAPGLYKRERFAFLPFLVAAPLLFTDEQAMQLVEWFRLNPITGALVYRRGYSRRSKGWGKSPVEAAKAIAEDRPSKVGASWASNTVF